MPTKPKHPLDKLSAAEFSAVMRKVSARSPWRKSVISRKSAKCQEYFQRLAEAGDTRRVPRPELD